MDVRTLITIIASLCAVSFSNGHPLPDDVRESAGNQKFIPGVFISSVALKNLQDRAQHNDMINQLGHEDQKNLEPLVSNPVVQDATVKVNPPSVDSQRIETVNPVLVNQAAASIPQPISVNQQPILTSQQPIVTNQQPVVTNQQPIVTNQQPIVTNQQPLILQQSPLSIQQPSLSSQPMLINQASLPNQQAIYVTQPGLNNQQPLLITQQPGQTILLNQQSSLANQQPTVVSQQPTVIGPQPTVISPQPTVISPQPSLSGQQLILQNGQIAQIAYQQPATVQNPTTLYAVVSTVPNPGVTNTNSYLVPIQQLQQTPNTVPINGK